jgi:aminoglycoside phosphotransferase (APT) family kinase protein
MKHHQNSQHTCILSESLARIGANPAQPLQFELLAGGVSGSYTYRVRLTTGEAILKATLPESQAFMLQRSAREAAFYRHLAPCVPLRVPQLLSSHAGDGVILLLDAHLPMAPTDWTQSRLLQFARQLGELHATFWKRTDALSGLHWLRRTAPEDENADVRQAYTYWEALTRQPHLRDVLLPKPYEWLHGMLARIGQLSTSYQPRPLTLCHGDCHMGNLLQDAQGNLVWADWQEVGLGRGPEDLSFFFQRAHKVPVPCEDLLLAYHESLQEATGEEISLTAVCRIVDAAELRTRLLYWPAYLTGAAAQDMAAMLCRMESLADRLELS